jgi:high-affinity K+ transport system ATPase subunit B
MSKHTQQPQSAFDTALLQGALLDSLKKLDPRVLWRNPVMLCVEIASLHYPGHLCPVALRRQQGTGLVYRRSLPGSG